VLGFIVGVSLLGNLAGVGSRSLAAEPEGTAVEYARDLESSDAKVRREAAYQLSRMGAGAKPALPQLIKALEDDQQQVWFGAITALANLKGDAEPALPALLKELESWQPFRKDRQGTQALYRTALALGSIGGPAIPGLSNALTHEKWSVRAGASRALGFTGPLASPIAPRLAGLLADERAEVRDAAADTLAGLGGAALDPLLEVLKTHEEPRARTGAAQTLGRLGPAGAPAEMALEEASSRDPELGVRTHALMAFSRVAPDPVRKMKVLVGAWDGPEESLRLTARSAMLTVRPVETVVLPVMVPRIESTNRVVRSRAAEFLTLLGPDAAVAAPVLARAIRSSVAKGENEPEMIRALAETGSAGLAEIFDEIGSSPPEMLDPKGWPLQAVRQVNVGALTTLIGSLGHASPSVRAATLEGLTALGERARAAAKKLPPLLDDPVGLVRARAWQASGACGVPAEFLLSRLEKGLEDTEPQVRRAVVLGLGQMGKAASAAAPKLIKVLQSGDPELERAAIRALGGMGADAAIAAPVLVEQMGRWGKDGPIDVLTALGGIGTAAAGELPKLLALSESPDPRIRRAFFETTVGFGTNATAALAAVDRGLTDGEPEVRAWAIRARVAVEPEDERSVQAALAGLDDAERVVRHAAAQMIGRLEERGRVAESKLFALLDQPDDRLVARDALRAIHPTSMDRLRDVLGHADPRVREMAADSLARLGKAATEAIPALEKALREDRSEEVKRAARRALRRIREG